MKSGLKVNFQSLFFISIVAYISVVFYMDQNITRLGFCP